MTLPITFARTPRDGGVNAASLPSVALAPEGHGALGAANASAPEATGQFRSMLSAALDSSVGEALERTRDHATRDAAALRRSRLARTTSDARDARMDATTAADASRRAREQRELSAPSAKDETRASPTDDEESDASDVDVPSERDAAERRAADALALHRGPNGEKTVGDSRPAGDNARNVGGIAPNETDTPPAAIGGEAGDTHGGPDALVPEMRDRLQRVIDRMEADYGYTVEIVETVRSQERQDTLFAQGRTAPGPVVTWTRSSNHLAGKAADVIIDGSYQNPAGFERLARVAREEGLRTLWPRDPGHIELVSSEATKGDTVVADGGDDVHTLPFPRGAVPKDGVNILPMPGERTKVPRGDVRILPMPGTGLLELDTGTGSIGAALAASIQPTRVESGIARVAQVAQVAQVASVAEVARVAQPGASEPMPATTIVAAPTMSQESNRTSDGASHGASEQRSFSSQQGDKEQADTSVAPVAPRDADTSRLLIGVESSAPLGRASSGDPVAGLAHTDATERIARMLSLQDAAAERPMSSLLLRLDHPEGGEDRIRIDMRGQSVGATFDVSDPKAADHLRAHTRELQQALQRQGLEGDTMVVRTSTRTTEPAAHNASAMAAERDAVRAGSASASDGGGFTAKDSRNQPRADDGREDKDHQRSRQRRDGHGER